LLFEKRTYCRKKIYTPKKLREAPGPVRKGLGQAGQRVHIGFQGRRSFKKSNLGAQGTFGGNARDPWRQRRKFLTPGRMGPQAEGTKKKSRSQKEFQKNCGVVDGKEQS